jgi:hypothetical protein
MGRLDAGGDGGYPWDNGLGLVGIRVRCRTAGGGSTIPRAAKGVTPGARERDIRRPG